MARAQKLSCQRAGTMVAKRIAAHTMSTFTLQRSLPTWRRLALSTWRQSDDPQIYGWLDIDATALTAYLSELKSQSDARVTVTHAVGKAAAIAFAESPECNAVPCLGGMRRRDSVDVFFSVAVGGGKSLSGAKIERADQRSLVEIAADLDARVGRIRGAGDTPLQRSQSLLGRFPSWLLRPAMMATAAATFDLGIDLARLGVPHDPFGTVVVTNVGVLGIEQGFAPLIPTGRTAAMLTVGKIRDKVIAVSGAAVVRPVLTIGGTFDHRIVDGFHLGKIAGALERVLGAPREHFDGRVADEARLSRRNANGGGCTASPAALL